MRVELSVQHSIQLLLQPSPDFFIEVIFAVEVVKHQIDEQLIGYLYAFHSLRFLSEVKSAKLAFFTSATIATIATIATVILVVSF
ncbi:hypothetical protein [Pyramidobacter piscolens]|uniref:hypothetical protein n=1 Tax=Pyramidobacter piscolens TaxID=638849 RepID=UPI003AF56351